MEGAVPPKPSFKESSWRKASFSYGGGECIEVGAASSGGRIGVRDSKVADSAVLDFSADEWRSFLSSITFR